MSIVVVLGKTSVNKLEMPHLIDIGRALAHRGHALHTTRTAGACRAIVEGYEKEGKSPTYLKPGGGLPDAEEVIVFTDAKFQKELDSRKPNWRDEGWLIIHNRKATQQAADWIKQVLAERGTPLDDG